MFRGSVYDNRVRSPRNVFEKTAVSDVINNPPRRPVRERRRVRVRPSAHDRATAVAFPTGRAVAYTRINTVALSAGIADDDRSSNSLPTRVLRQFDGRGQRYSSTPISADENVSPPVITDVRFRSRPTGNTHTPYVLYAFTL